MTAQAHLPVHTAPELCRWALLPSWCFTATETARLIKDVEGSGVGNDS